MSQYSSLDVLVARQSPSKLGNFVDPQRLDGRARPKKDVDGLHASIRSAALRNNIINAAEKGRIELGSQ